MKTVKKILACLLSILTICSCMGIAAFAEEVGGAINENLTWSFDTETGVLSINGTGPMEDYFSSIFVQSSSPWGSYAKDIRAVQIAEGVTRIGWGSFKGCNNLTSVTIPDSVTSIRNEVFIDTGIYSDASNWTDGVLYIGNHLIKAQSSLSGTYAVKAGTKCIADDAFFDCIALTSITLPSSLKGIGAYAFGRCTALTDITLPDGVTNICGSAFDDCTALENIFIPQSVTSIEDLEEGTFGNGCSSLTHITVDPENPSYSSDENGVLFDKNKTTLLRFPVGSATTAYAVPNGVKTIENKAFYTCASLETIMFPQGLEVISDNAFSGCTELRSVTFSNGLKSIGNDAFEKCTSLTDITFPDGLKSIGNYVFYKCISLTNVILPDSVTDIGAGTFTNTALYLDKSNWTDGVLYVGNHLVRAEYTLGGTCEVKPGTKCIAQNAFTGCSSLNSIHIPAGVSEIGEYILLGSGAYICSDTADCYAKEYADRYGIEFRVCDGSHLPEIRIENPSGKTFIFPLNPITLQVQAKNLPDGARLVWQADKKNVVTLTPSEDGMTCKVEAKWSRTVNITVKAVDADGNVICESEAMPVRSVGGIFGTVIGYILWAIELSKRGLFPPNLPL